MADHVGFVAIHWATGVGYSKRAEDPTLRTEYLDTLGGWFRRPPCGVQIGRSELHRTNERHPICRGWQGWRIHDEFYLNPVLHDRAKPLLEVNVDGQRQVVGWTFHRASGGRSVGITLGHFHHNFARDDFRRLLINSILWSAELEVPDDGAPVDLDPAELKLPPQTVK